MYPYSYSMRRLQRCLHRPAWLAWSNEIYPGRGWRACHFATEWVASSVQAPKQPAKHRTAYSAQGMVLELPVSAFGILLMKLEVYL